MSRPLSPPPSELLSRDHTPTSCNDTQCPVMIKKKCARGHVSDLPCHLLHPSKESPEGVPFNCVVIVSKRCPRPYCGREAIVPCHEAKTKTDLLCAPCTLVLRPLPCGHFVETPTAAHEKASRSIKCPILVWKDCPSCGRPNQVHCHKDASEHTCRRMVTKALPNCGHPVKVPCYQKPRRMCAKMVEVLCEAGIHTMKVRCGRRSLPSSAQNNSTIFCHQCPQPT